jgi:hypothetical protein
LHTQAPGGGGKPGLFQALYVFGKIKLKKENTANNNFKIKSILKRYPCILNTLQ